jgi:PAS domain S-box-containing protein
MLLNDHVPAVESSTLNTELLTSIIDVVSVGIVVVNHQGVIEMVNATLCQMFGYSAYELIGEQLAVLIPARYREKHVELREKYQNNPSMRAMGAGRDLTGVNKSGKEFPIEIGLGHINSSDAPVSIATINDISERKKLETFLRKVNNDLDEFTYVASHDLKSPLRGILSLVEWIEEDIAVVATDEVKHNLQRINIRIERMENMIEALLDYARCGKETSDYEQVNVGDMLQDMVELLQVPDGFAVNIENRIGTIECRKTPFETVIRNLLTNAIKHHDKEQGTVSLRLYPEDSWAMIEVEDDGPGIPDAAKERVFKLFQTLNSESDERSGLGLSITKRLVEQHGGYIEVTENKNGRGACFIFSWPLYARSDY